MEATQVIPTPNKWQILNNLYSCVKIKVDHYEVIEDIYGELESVLCLCYIEGDKLIHDHFRKIVPSTSINRDHSYFSSEDYIHIRKFLSKIINKLENRN